MITADRLVAIGVKPQAAELHAPYLQAAALRFDIHTLQRQAYFIAQAAHETDMLEEFEENLHYKSAERIKAVFPSRMPTIELAQRFVGQPERLANFVYSNRFGNGNIATGDGWAYRGRGGGHLTFKDNYRDAGVALGRRYVDNPDLVAEPEHAALTFAWYWHSRKCNIFADNGDVDAVTKAINPGMAGKENRARLTQLALKAYDE